VQALGAAGEGAPDPSEAWSLFADRDRVEQLMTDEIRAGLALSYGLAIPRAAAET